MSVLDASVVLKWFVDEEDSSQALNLREEFYAGKREIVVPDLLLFEIANALRYNASFSVKEIRESLGTLFGIGIEMITPTLSLLGKTVELAEKLDLTCYDATYLALAEELGFELITADERLYRKIVKNSKFKASIRLLADFSTHS
jgi:predicted nucleic acid-binding protein